MHAIACAPPLFFEGLDAACHIHICLKLACPWSAPLVQVPVLLEARNTRALVDLGVKEGGCSDLFALEGAMSHRWYHFKRLI